MVGQTDGRTDRKNVTSRRRNQIKLQTVYNNYDREKNQACKLSYIIHVISYAFIMFGYLFFLSCFNSYNFDFD